MKVVLLAGGIGKRMEPIQKDKCLLKFFGKELILHQIELAEKAGLKDFLIIGNPVNIEKIKEIVGKKAEYAVQKEAKGMADALLSAKEKIRGQEILILKTNDIFEIEGYKKVLEKKGDCVILGYKVKEYFPGGYLTVEGDKIKGIVEKPGEGNEPSDLVNLVVHVHRKTDELIKYMEKAKTDKDDQYEVALDNMMKDGFDFRVAVYGGFWTGIQYPFHIFKVMNYFLGKIEKKYAQKGNAALISKKAKISDKAVIEGNVIIEDGVKVFENAVIKGPCYIGKNSIIGNNCLVRESMISENCIVGFGSEIARSYVSDGTMIHMSYAGDSIIMDNCNLGAGTVTANWRFDGKEIKMNVGENNIGSPGKNIGASSEIGEGAHIKRIGTGSDKFGCVMGENCKTGINVSIMPGVKIGHNSKIGPHVMLAKDLGKGKIVLLKQEHEVVEK